MSASIAVLRREREPGRRYAAYLEEILMAEGFVSFDSIVLSSGTNVEPTALKGYDLIVLSTSQIDPTEAAVLEAYVADGGGLIALRPPKELGPLCGLVFTGGTTGNGYVRLEERHPLAQGLCREALQYHSVSDLCTLQEGEAMAWLATHPHRSTLHPAVVTRQHGLGRVATFTYDLASSTLHFHQGDPERVGPGPDGYARPLYRFAGHVDRERLSIPPADMQQRFLVKLLQWTAGTDRPLPRLWYFPHKARAAALLTGDSDGCSAEDIQLIARTVETYGGTYTTYIKESDHSALLPDFVDALRARGHDFGPHIWCGPNPSPETMRAGIHDQVARYKERYRHQPRTHRGHCLVWIGWVDTGKYLAEAGIALDTNFVSGITVGAGYMTGSGLPMRFMDETGAFIACGEQPTQWEDDCHIEGTSFYSEGFTIAEAIEATKEMLRRSVDEYHTMINFNFHPIHVRTELQTLTWIRETAKFCYENDIPMLSGEAWVSFNEARRSVEVAHDGWQDDGLHFTLTSPHDVTGLTLILPSILDRRRVVDVTVNGRSATPCYMLIDGDEHALISLDLNAGESKRIHYRVSP